MRWLSVLVVGVLCGALCLPVTHAAEWKRLYKADEYRDAVSNVTNLILRPAAGSQI